MGECLELNPKIDKSKISDDRDVHFVPMPAVEALSNKIDTSEVRKFGAVKKGYTPFTSNDVLFAKITPCMENGKMVVVPELRHGLAFGSTEFHVLRTNGDVMPEWVFYFVSSHAFRAEAEHNMTGAVGQRRVRIDFIAQHEISLPPLNEQKRIVEKIEELFSEIDAGVASLQRAREQLGVYRQALLKK
ncbi:MAG: restriction endonuclease subunit S, partial [Opitutales bacterium]